MPSAAAVVACHSSYLIGTRTNITDDCKQPAKQKEKKNHFNPVKIHRDLIINIFIVV